MTVLLSYSTNLFATDTNSYESYNTHNENDSVYISYDDLRIVNSKLIELEYEKEINKNLREIIDNDVDIIDNYRKLQLKTSKETQQAIKQKNIFIGTTIGFSVITVLVTTLLFIK